MTIIRGRDSISVGTSDRRCRIVFRSFSGVVGACCSSDGGVVSVGSVNSGSGRLRPCNAGDIFCSSVCGARLPPLDPVRTLST